MHTYNTLMNDGKEKGPNGPKSRKCLAHYLITCTCFILTFQGFRCSSGKKKKLKKQCKPVLSDFYKLVILKHIYEVGILGRIQEFVLLGDQW